MSARIVKSIGLLFLALISFNITAATVNPDQLVLEGDYQVSEGDPLRVTAYFDGSFTSISSVQIIMYLSDFYSKNESYKLTFYNDSGDIVKTTSHVNDSPFADQHLGYLTNSSVVKNQFMDGMASFELEMLAGSVNISSIAVNINGVFSPNPVVVPLPAAASLFGLSLSGLLASARKRKEVA